MVIHQCKEDKLQLTYDPQTGAWTYVSSFPSPTTDYFSAATRSPNVLAITSGRRSYVFDSAATCNPILISQTTLANATVAALYSQSLTATGIIVTPEWSISAGALPSGLTLNAATGELSGVPANAGTFNFTVRATGGNCFGEQNYSLVVGKGVTTVTVTAQPRAVGSTLNYAAKVVRMNAAANFTGDSTIQK